MKNFIIRLNKLFIILCILTMLISMFIFTFAPKDCYQDKPEYTVSDGVWYKYMSCITDHHNYMSAVNIIRQSIFVTFIFVIISSVTSWLLGYGLKLHLKEKK